MSDADKTVLIIGGGPAGLTLANALQVKGVACKVFERNKKTFVKTVGAGFCLSHGRLWLESISEEIKKGISEITTPVPGIKVVERAEGEESAIGVYDMSKSPKVEKGLRGPILAGCTRSSLMNMLHSKLKPGTVELGWECKDINENENGTMTVKFDVEEVDEAGKKSKKSVSETGAVVVGADGMHSKVRQLMFGPKMLQVYDQGGWLLLQRDIPKSVVDFTKRENQFVRLVAPNIGDDIACVGYPTSPGDFELCIAYKISKGGNGHSWKNDRYASSLRKKEVLETMKKMPGNLGKIASLAESPEDLVHISLSDSSASLDLKEWHLGRVVIIGDAPHGPTVSCLGTGLRESKNYLPPTPSYRQLFTLFLRCSRCLERVATLLLAMPVSSLSTLRRPFRISARTRSELMNSSRMHSRDTKASARNLARVSAGRETKCSPTQSLALSCHSLLFLPGILSRFCCEKSWSNWRGGFCTLSLRSSRAN